MPFFKESDLRAASSQPLALKANFHLQNSRSMAVKSIFLSHSHKDREMANGLRNYLGGLGITLYVDWNDSDLPRITNRDTANGIKTKIYELDFFLVLVTENALKSRWVPWEIGVADKSKYLGKIAIVPVMDNYGKFEGNEYLQIYNRIELNAVGSIAFSHPNQSWTTKTVSSWLLS